MNYQSRARNLFILAALLLGAHAYASAQPPAPAPTQPRAAQPARKKRLPPGPKGFEQYAGRDSSDKLIVGAATRAGGQPAPSDAGLKRYALGDLNGAVTAFEQALRLAPDDAELHYSLATVLGELDRNEESAAEFRQALGCHPDDAQRLLATYNLGNAYLDMGRYREAVARYAEVVALDPTLANPYYNMGLAYAGWGAGCGGGEAVRRGATAQAGVRRGALQPRADLLAARAQERGAGGVEQTPAGERWASSAAQ